MTVAVFVSSTVLVTSTSEDTVTVAVSSIVVTEVTVTGVVMKSVPVTIEVTIEETAKFVFVTVLMVVRVLL